MQNLFFKKRFCKRPLPGFAWNGGSKPFYYILWLKFFGTQEQNRLEKNLANLTKTEGEKRGFGIDFFLFLIYNNYVSNWASPLFWGSGGLVSDAERFAFFSGRDGLDHSKND